MHKEQERQAGWQNRTGWLAGWGFNKRYLAAVQWGSLLFNEKSNVDSKGPFFDVMELSCNQCAATDTGHKQGSYNSLLLLPSYLPTTTTPDKNKWNYQRVWYSEWHGASTYAFQMMGKPNAPERPDRPKGKRKARGGRKTNDRDTLRLGPCPNTPQNHLLAWLDYTVAASQPASPIPSRDQVEGGMDREETREGGGQRHEKKVPQRHTICCAGFF